MPKMIRLAALTLLPAVLAPVLAPPATPARAADAPPEKSEKSAPGESPAPAESAAPSAGELVKQRVAAAERAMDLAERLYRAGTGNAQDVYLWTQRWLQARLEAARGREERIGILKEYVELARRNEQIAEQRYKSGLANALEAEGAHYFRLDAELRLARQVAGTDDEEAVMGVTKPDRPAGDSRGAGRDERALQGKWKVVKKVKNGAPEDEGEAVFLTFAGNTVAQTHGDSRSQGTFTLDASHSPRHITLTGTSGEKAGSVFNAIYEFDGNTLKLAYSTGENAKTPPKDFSGGEGSGLLVLERQAADHPDRKE